MALRYYEAMWLFDSAVVAKDVEAAIKHVEELLKKQDAVIIRLEKWDDRKLAYDIKGVKRGTYIVGYFQCEPSKIEKLRRDSRLSELVLRHLVLEDKDLLKKIKEREELKKKRELEAAQAASEGLPVEGERGRYRDERPRYRDRERPRREAPPQPAEEVIAEEAAES